VTYPTTRPAVLTKALDDITRNDRYPFSEPIHTLKAILAKLIPEPVREPSPPPRRCMRHREQRPPENGVRLRAEV
jgi:hypothetical protein